MVQVDAIQARQTEMVEQAIEHWRPQVQGRVVVVTGGARGIGKTISEGLLKAGAKVVATDMTWVGSEEFRAQLESSKEGMALEMDVTDNAQLDAAYAAVMKQFGTTDVLINNAALVSETLFHPKGRVKLLDTKDSDWETMFNVNVFGVVKATRRFIKPMIEKGSGSIINLVSRGAVQTSSGGGYFAPRPWTVEMPYQATKGAVVTTTFYLAEEVRNQGVAVNAIMPGHTRASWFDTTARAYGEQGAVYGVRPVIPEHLLPITLFLASQDGQGTTGRLYPIPEWNYDHGYGDYAAWLDRALPPDMEEIYIKVEEVAPTYVRSGVPQSPPAPPERSRNSR